MTTSSPQSIVDLIQTAHAPIRPALARIAGTSIAAIVLAGCNVGPDYKGPPATTLPTHFANALPATNPTVPVDLAGWWKSFNDPTLDALMEQSVAGNLDLKLATSRVREARALRGIVAADGYPHVNVGGAYSRQRQSENTASGSATSAFGGDLDSDFYTAGFDASWELDVFGGTRRSVEAANADIETAVEGRRATLVSLLAEVGRNYIELRGAQRELAITNENARSQRETAQLREAKFAAGLVGELDVRRARAQVAATESQAPVFEAAIRRSIHRLSVLTGKDPGALSSLLLKEAPIPSAIPAVPVGLPSDLLRRRPDIRRAERALAASNARIGQAVADLFPRFSLTGSLGLQSSKFENWGSLNSRYWSVGPSVSWPVFSAGRIRSNVAVQNARQEQAAILYEQTVLSALEDVENALVGYSQQDLRRQSLQQAVTDNQRALVLARDLYDRGLIDFLSVLDAQRNLFVAQDALVQSEQSVSANLVALYKALGGGWDASASPSTRPAAEALDAAQLHTVPDAR